MTQPRVVGPPGPVPVARARATSGMPAAPAVALIAGLSIVWAWWAWKEGAYFGVVFYPGSLVLLALLAITVWVAPWPLRLAGGARVALFALFGIGAWTAVSILWSPTKDIAVDDAERAIMYGVAFLLGLWMCGLLQRRMLLSAAPLAIAGAVVGLAAVITIWAGHDIVNYLETDGTLRFPLGYRNAAAAFFLICFWPAVILAAGRGLSTWARVLLLASATLEIELGVLAQSRGSVTAGVLAIATVLIVSHERLRVTTWMLLAVLPALPALPLLLHVYSAAADGRGGALGALHHACIAILLTTALSALIAFVAVRLEPRVQLPERAARRIGGIAALVAVLALVAGAGVFIERGNTPAGFVDKRVDELTKGTPNLHNQGTRYGLNLGSSRGDFWRVAWDDFRAHPIKGEGGGGFRFSYLRDRHSHSAPEDPHSVEMLMLSELGLPGAIGLLALIGGAGFGAWRSRALGPAASSLSTAALAAGAYWLGHASVDWFWSYPALTAPVMALLGAACAPALLSLEAEEPTRRGPVLLAIVALALTMIPPFISQRWTNDALSSWRSDPQRAFDNLSSARAANQLSDAPLLAEAEIAKDLDQTRLQVEALRRADRRTPDFWYTHYALAKALADSDPAEARRELAEAKRLNPKSPVVKKLERTLGAGSGSAAGG